MNEDQPTAEQPIEAQLAEPRRDDAQRFESLTRDPRRRLRELVAIPDRDRTDALWDEIIGLEIQLAPGNSAPSPQADAGRHQEPGRQNEPAQRPGWQKPGKRSFKRSN